VVARSKVLAHFARHYRTGEPMPQALLEKIMASVKFNQGFDTLEYLEAAIVDQNWHQIPAGKTPHTKDVIAFEAATLKRAGVDYYAVPPRYHSPYFAHIFQNSYSAGYYAYIGATFWRRTASTGSAPTAAYSAPTAISCGQRFSPRDSVKIRYTLQGVLRPSSGRQPLLQFRGLNAIRKLP